MIVRIQILRHRNKHPERALQVEFDGTSTDFIKAVRLLRKTMYHNWPEESRK